MSSYNSYGENPYYYDYFSDLKKYNKDYTITWTLGPNGVEEEVEGPPGVTTEEALRILREYSGFIRENRITRRPEPIPAIPAQPTRKKEPPKPQVKVLTTRADQLQMELDQIDKVQERKEMEIDQRFASLELE